MRLIQDPAATQASTEPQQQRVSSWTTLISERMLQQTRVGSVVQVLPYFLIRFPNAFALSVAPLEEVERIVAPLGFTTSRPLELQVMAEQIVQTYEGEVPSTVDELLNLTGVGGYTASAVASIAFTRQVPAVDTNSIRVFSRVKRLTVGGRANGSARNRNYNTIYALTAPVLLATSRPGDVNQAIMELGQRICTIRTPRCSECPLQAMCQSSNLEW